MNHDNAFAKLIKAASGRDDTLSYRLVADRVITKSTVRMSLQVTALVNTKEYQQSALEQRIQQSLAKFIPAKWAFLGTKRTADASGYERVTTSVAAQVSAAENWNLEERARQASSEGLSLGSVVVDYASPRNEVDRMVKELRTEILTHVQQQITDYTKLTKRPWRIGHIEFGVSETDRPINSKGAYRNDSSRDDSLEHAELADGSERISLRANVNLYASV